MFTKIQKLNLKMFVCGSATKLLILIVASITVFDFNVISESVEQQITQNDTNDRTQIMLMFWKLATPLVRITIGVEKTELSANGSSNGENDTITTRNGIVAPKIGKQISLL